MAEADSSAVIIGRRIHSSERFIAGTSPHYFG